MEMFSQLYAVNTAKMTTTLVLTVFKSSEYAVHNVLSMQLPIDFQRRGEITQEINKVML